MVCKPSLREEISPPGGGGDGGGVVRYGRRLLKLCGGRLRGGLSDGTGRDVASYTFTAAVERPWRRIDDAGGGGSGRSWAGPRRVPAQMPAQDPRGRRHLDFSRDTTGLRLALCLILAPG